MRIAFVSDSWPEYTILLANSLSELCEIHLFSPLKVVEDITHLIDSKVIKHFYKQIPFRSPQNLVNNYQLTKSILALRPDVIHFQGTILWFLPFWIQLSNLPVVITIHDPWLHKGEWRLSNWLNLKLSILADKYFIVHGNKLKEFMVNQFHLRKDNVFSIPHGEFSIYKNWLTPTSPSKDKEVLFFGRIYPYKGLHVLLEAVPLVLREIPDVKFIIAGDRGGTYLENLLPSIKNNNCIELHNEYIARTLVAEFMSRASFIVLPYIDASQSGVIPLAFGFGKTVIASNVGSLAEIVKDGINGIIIPPNDPLALAEAVISLLKNDSYRAALEKNIEETIKTDLSWKDIAKKHCNAYYSIIEKPRKFDRNS